MKPKPKMGKGGMKRMGKSQRMKPNPFFSSVSSVKPEPDAAPRKMLTARQKKKLATRPI